MSFCKLRVLLVIAAVASMPTLAVAQYRCAVAIDLKGKTVLAGEIRDVERPPTDELWKLLKTLSFSPGKDGADLPDPKVTEKATLKGELRVKVNGAGQVALTELRLVRNPFNDAAWVIAPEDVTRILALRAAGKEDKGDGVSVRALKFAPKDPTVVFGIGGQSKLTALKDAAAVEKLVGKDAAKQLLDAVDFEKEQIVLVSWTTSGPPDGMLKHELKGTGKDRKVNFYVQGPPGAKVRGQRARLGADFFAVPAKMEVSFEAKERN
jgi:hypothetical protein